MKLAPAIILDAPAKKGGAFLGRAVVSQRPISAEIAVEIPKFANPFPRELAGTQTLAGGERLLP